MLSLRLVLATLWRRMVVPWSILAFGLLGGLLFCLLISVTRQVDGISVLVSTLGFVMVIVNPVLATLAWSDSRHNRVHEVWLTSPVLSVWVVMVHWGAALSIVVGQMAALSGVVIAVAWVGSPDWGKVATAILGLLALGAFFSAIGVWAAIQTRRVISAGILGITTALLIWLLGPFSAIAPSHWSEWVRAMALVHHTFGFEQGIIVAADWAYFGIGILIFLVAATQRIAGSRLGRTRWYGYPNLVAVVVVVLAINVLAQRLDWRSDWSNDRQLTVQSETLSALKIVGNPILIRAYFQPGTEEAFKVEQVLRQLQAGVPGLTATVIDMDRFPRTAVEDQVASVGTVVVQLGRTRRLLAYQDVFTASDDGHDRMALEGALVAAVRSMTSHRSQGVYYVVGHGQAPIDSFSGRSLSRWLRIIELDGWSVRPIRMGQFGAIPTDSVVVLTAPRYPMANPDVEALTRFIKAGGRLLLATDYNADPSMATLLRTLGVRAGDRLISDPELSMFRTPSILIPVLSQTPITAPILTQELSVVMPIAVPLSIQNAAAKVPLAQTGAKSVDDAGQTGPFVVAAAIGLGDGGALVFGDTDWMTNDMIDVAGNRLMALQAIRFLAGDLMPHPADGHGHRVPISDGQWIWVLCMSIGLPVGLGAGLGVWQWRRRV